MSNKAKFSHEEIDRRLDALAARHGVTLHQIEGVPTVTVVIVPVVRSNVERLHVLADLRMAADPTYSEVSEKLDAELRGMLEGVRPALTPSPRPKSTRAERIRTND